MHISDKIGKLPVNYFTRQTCPKFELGPSRYGVVNGKIRISGVTIAGEKFKV